MLIDTDKLSKALDSIKALASMDKEAPGILFDIKDDTAEILYQTAQKAVKNVIPVTVESDEEKRIVVFDYRRLTDIIDYCKPSGEIKVKNIEFSFRTNPDGSGTAKIKAVKRIKFSDAEATDDDNEGEVASVYDQELSWWGIENLNNRRKVLSVNICPNMYDTSGATTWEAGEFKRVLSEVTNGDSPTVYIAEKVFGMFAKNTNSSLVVKTGTPIEGNVQISTNYARATVTAFANVADDTTVFSNGILDDNGALQACVFFTENKEVAVYMAAATRRLSDVQAITRNSTIEYKTFQVTMRTSVIKDALKAAVNLNAQTTGTIKFIRDGEKVTATINAVDTGASVANEYKVVCDMFRTSLDIPEGQEELVSITTSLVNLLSIVNFCKKDMLGLDITSDESGIFLRVGFVDGEKCSQLTNSKATEMGINQTEMTSLDKMELRSDYVDTCYYIPVQTN